jgi:uncharacterized membrane protein YphA (DoxX/SURF4 family)
MKTFNWSWMMAVLLAVLFLYTGLVKLLDLSDFNRELSNSPYLHKIHRFIAIGLPLFELAVSFFLLYKEKTRKWGLYAAFFLMCLFTAYIYMMLTYSYYLPCSCGGIISGLSWPSHLKLNIGFTILAAIGILLFPDFKRRL